MGETIDIASVLDLCSSAARDAGFEWERFPVHEGVEIVVAHRSAPLATPDPRRFYLSAGIHGDEPAGPLAVLSLLRENRFPADAELWICPCLNPRGFRMNRRTNPEGIDLNRDYNHRRSHEVRAHLEWLGTLPRLDLTVLLHEDWESAGFYLYELNPDALPPVTLAADIIQQVSRVCPIETAAWIDGRPSNGAGVIHPPTDPAARPDWPEAFWLLQNRSRRNLTLEAPSDFPLSVRVSALSTATLRAFQAVRPREGAGA